MNIFINTDYLYIYMGIGSFLRNRYLGLGLAGVLAFGAASSLEQVVAKERKVNTVKVDTSHLGAMNYTSKEKKTIARLNSAYKKANIKDIPKLYDTLKKAVVKNKRLNNSYFLMWNTLSFVNKNKSSYMKHKHLFQDFLSLSKRLVRKNPRNPLFQYVCGSAYDLIKFKVDGEAVKHYGKVISLLKRLPVKKRFVEKNTGVKEDLLFKSYERLIHAHGAPYTWKGNKFIRGPSYHATKKRLHQALTQFPKVSNFHIISGKLAFYEKNYKTALKSYQNALKVYNLDNKNKHRTSKKNMNMWIRYLQKKVN